MNSTHIFIYGQSIHNFRQSFAFIFNHKSETWTSFVNNTINVWPDKYYRHTCAFLKPLNIAFVTIDNDQVGLLNITSLSWDVISAPTQNGVVFNGDDEKKVVYFIGPSNKSSAMSNAYRVKCIYYWAMLIKTL